MRAAAASVQNQGWQTAAQQQFADWAADTDGSLQGAGQQQGASSCLSSSVVAPTSALLFQDGALPVAAAFSFAAAGSSEGPEAHGTAHSWGGPAASALLRHLGDEPGCFSRRSGALQALPGGKPCCLQWLLHWWLCRSWQALAELLRLLALQGRA